MSKRSGQQASRGDKDTVANLGQERDRKTNPSGGEEDPEVKLEATLDARALQIKRWEVQEGPFQGFNSPPGRF